MILLAFVGGAMTGAILLFLSHIAPRFGAGNFIRDLDEPRVFGKILTRREAHLLGALLHLLMSIAAAVSFAYLVARSVFPGFGLLSLLGWGVVLTIVIGGIILPLEGHGLFGVKEDAWFPIDLFLMNVLWSVLFWWLMKMLLPLAA